MLHVPMQRQRRQPARRQGQVSVASLQHLGLTPAQQQQVVDMRARLEPRQEGQGQGALQAEAPAELAELDKVSPSFPLGNTAVARQPCVLLLVGRGQLQATSACRG